MNWTNEYLRFKAIHNTKRLMRANAIRRWW